jgi:hypothetical protein
MHLRGFDFVQRVKELNIVGIKGTKTQGTIQLNIVGTLRALCFCIKLKTQLNRNSQKEKRISQKLQR